MHKNWASLLIHSFRPFLWRHSKSSTTQRRSRLQHGYCVGVSRRSAPLWHNLREAFIDSHEMATTPTSKAHVCSELLQQHLAERKSLWSWFSASKINGFIGLVGVPTCRVAGFYEPAVIKHEPPIHPISTSTPLHSIAVCNCSNVVILSLYASIASKLHWDLCQRLQALCSIRLCPWLRRTLF